MKVDLLRPSREIVELAVDAIRQGGVVLHPTDTVYGLACDPFNQAALELLLALKQRSRRQGFLLLIPEAGWAERLSASRPPIFLPLCRRFWPGPVTLLLPAGNRVPSLVRGEEGKVGLRMPQLPLLRQWLQALDSPLVSTSANLSGRPAPSLAGLKRLFQDRVGLFLEAEASRPATPSTVADLADDPPRIVRRGEESDAVERFLAENRG